MSITDIFRGRGNARQGRTVFSTTPTRKLRERESLHGSSFGEDTLGPIGIFFCMLLVVASVAILDYGVLPPMYQEGVRPPADIRSRLEFKYNDPNELNRLREEAADKAPRVYEEDTAWVDKMTRDLAELIGTVEVAQNLQDLHDRAARFPADAQLVEELYKYNQAAGEIRKFLSTILLGRIRSSLQRIAEDGIVSAKDLDFERNKRGERRSVLRIVPAGKIARSKITRTTEIPVERLHSVDMVSSNELMRASWREGLPREVERQIIEHFSTRLTPNLTLDTAQTEHYREMAQDAIGTGLVEVKAKELILSKDRRILHADLNKLQEEYRAYKAQLPREARLKHLLGLGAATFGVVIVFIYVTSRSDPRTLMRRRALVMLGLLSLATLAAARALMLTGNSAAATPFVFIGMVASLAFGQTVASLTLFALCCLTTLAGIRWEAYPIEGGVPVLALALLAGGIGAAIPVERLRDRWDLLRYGAIGGFTQGVLMAGMAWMGTGLNGSPMEADSPVALALRSGVPTLSEALLALATGPLCGLLVLGSLPLIEMAFGILTNIRLFELADLNRPLLRRLLEEAPGTFQHTLHVRFLCEPASDAIGANTRLISAGVLYHDIGKLLKPEYFVENQLDAPERHKRLRPSVSALLITAHVKDGIELAREYRLPEQIIHFIPEHHGTTLVSYFYHSAKKAAESQGADSGGSDSVQEAFFRYPGPRPQSRETAIVMLADTVEAASRTLENPSAARISVFVHDLIMDKMLDGQLDECDLTFADLAKIEEAFVRVLVTRSHARIRYPGQEGHGDTGGDAHSQAQATQSPITPPPHPSVLSSTPAEVRDDATKRESTLVLTAEQKAEELRASARNKSLNETQVVPRRSSRP